MLKASHGLQVDEGRSHHTRGAYSHGYDQAMREVHQLRDYSLPSIWC